MSEVNLLPGDIREKQRTRRTTVLVGLLGVVVLVAIGFFYFLQALNLSSVKDDLEAQEAVNAEIQAQIQELAKFGDMQAQVQERRELVDVVFANEIAWSGVLLDVSRVVPNEAFIESLSGIINLPTGAAPATVPTIGQQAGLVGAVSFEGQAFNVRTVAEWLTRLEQIKGWVNPWVTTASEQGPATNRYDFASGVDLSTAAVTKRGQVGQL